MKRGSASANSWLAASLIFGLFLASCGRHSQPNFTFMPDMAYSPALKAQKVLPRPPVPGTIPRGFVPYRFTSLEDAGRGLSNPLSPTKAVLARGQVIFNSYCLTCHGPEGEGNGTVVPPFPRPPSLQSEKIRNYADGSIFHVVSRGQNIMPSYASQISVSDRWAAIHYIRVLQKAKHPSPEDVKAYEAAHGK